MANRIGFNTEYGFVALGTYNPNTQMYESVGNSTLILFSMLPQYTGEHFIECDSNHRIRWVNDDWQDVGQEGERSYINPIQYQYKTGSQWITYAFINGMYMYRNPDYVFYDGFYYFKDSDNNYYLGGNEPVIVGEYVGIPPVLISGNESENKTFNDWVSDILIEEETGSPFDGGGFSETGGGRGDWDNTSDIIEIPEVPTVGAHSSGLIKLYTPTYTQLMQIANYLWTDSAWEFDSFRKVVANPMDCIVSLAIFPFTIPSSGASEIMVGNLSTGITCNRATNQFIEIDCGSLQIKEFSGSYLDYSPYTKAEIYLPYIGVQSINVDDIMGRTIRVVYHVDVLTGTCVAFISVNGTTLYSFEGVCGTCVPITSTDFSTTYSSVLQGVGSAVGLGMALGTGNATASVMGALSMGSSIASNISNMKPHIQRGSSISASNGLMGVQTPYITFQRPKQCLPQYQEKFSGYPSFITTPLTSISGYTEVYSIHLENIPATDFEKSEIKRLLKEGVIF